MGRLISLPGKGEPLRLHEHPNEPADMRMANKLLRDNELTPGWIGDRKGLLAEIEALRAEMQRQWDLTCARREATGSDKEDLARSWQSQSDPVGSAHRRPEPADRQFEHHSPHLADGTAPVAAE